MNQSPTNASPEESSPSSPPRHVPTRGLYGWITHTELASSDPASTKAWCSKVLGWTFKPASQYPAVSTICLPTLSKGEGGEFVRSTHLKYQVAHHMYMSRTLRMPLRKRCAKGTGGIAANTDDGGVTMAIVRAPGDVQIGFSGP